MSALINQHWVYKNQPIGNSVTTGAAADATLELKKDAVDPNSLQKGQVLLKLIYYSNDPFLQLLWTRATPEMRAGVNWIPELNFGDDFKTIALGKVVHSENSKFKKNDYVEWTGSWAEYEIVDGDKFDGKIVDTSDPDIPLVYQFTLLGLTSLTAATGIFCSGKLDYEDPATHNKVALVTGAAGGVGSFGVQLFSKIFKAKKVLAVAGGPEKAKWVESLGPNVIGLDYKDSENYLTKLEEVTKQYGQIDYVLDSVAGEILVKTLPFVNVGATIIHCGASSGDSTTPLYNINTIFFKKLNIHSYVVSDYEDQWESIKSKIIGFIKHGLVESKAFIIDGKGGNFAKIPETWQSTLTGANKGKSITQVSEE